MPYFEKGNINRQVDLLIRDMSTWAKCPNCQTTVLLSQLQWDGNVLKCVNCKGGLKNGRKEILCFK